MTIDERLDLLRAADHGLYTAAKKYEAAGYPAIAEMLFEIHKRQGLGVWAHAHRGTYGVTGDTDIADLYRR